MDLDIRPAGPGDLPELLAAAARASGLSDIEGGADPRYVTHLLDHGRLLVAVDPAGVIDAYAGSIPVGATTMLTDLFVRPDARSSGLGAALLSRLFDGVGHRMTHSSSDPRAVALYARSGMAPLLPLLYLRGSPDRLRPRFAVVRTTSGVAAAAEAEITGVDREATYAYWCARSNSTGVLLRDGDRVVAAGVTGGEGAEYGLTHLAVAHGTDPADAVTSALATATGTAKVALPGPHPALVPLLEAGFRIVDTDTFMTSGPNPYAGGISVGSPGLY